MWNKELQFSGWKSTVVALMIAGVALAACPARAAGAEVSRAEQERDLIALLKSDAAPGDKAIACKKLAIYGSEEAVPVLAPLLADPDLASWARIALEAIPGPAVDEALLRAMDTLQGRLLVGDINSIGVRRLSQATRGLISKLKETDTEVASAAAAALGRIGGPQAARALRRDLNAAPSQVRPAVAKGCIECAEQFLADGKRGAALRLYDAVRKAEVPEQKRLEGMRGAILARQSRGIGLLLEMLRSDDKMTFRIGLRVARELPGHEATVALAKELGSCSASRQPLMLLALADRDDDLAMPIIVDAAQRGPKDVRLVAIQVLEHKGKLKDVPVLLEAATDKDEEIAQEALGALTRLSVYGVDDDLLSRMRQPSQKESQVLIALAGKRRIMGAVPALLSYAQSSAPEVRSGALEALASIGDEGQIGDLVKLLQSTPTISDRLEIEKSLVAICGRAGAACAHDIVPLASNADPAIRAAGLHILAAAGGSEALAAIQSAVQDKDDAVQDEAVRTLATWPNTWPDDAAIAQPLLTLARSGKKMSHQVLALRGYLQYVQGEKRLNGEEKVAKVNEVLPLITRPDEKRLAIATIGDIPSAATLKLLADFAAEPGVSEEACSALVNAAARKMPGVAKQEREQALRVVLERSTNANIKNRAETALKNMQ